MRQNQKSGAPAPGSRNFESMGPRASNRRAKIRVGAPQPKARPRAVEKRQLNVSCGRYAHLRAGALCRSIDFLERETFDPEVVALLCEACEDVLDTLGLADRVEVVTELVAEKIIKLAHAGERDRDRLKQLTLEAFEDRS